MPCLRSLVRTLRRPITRRPASRLHLEGLEERITPGFAAPTGYGTPANAMAVTSADLDGDGDLDLVVSDSQGVGPLKNNGNGTFGAYTNYGVGGTFPRWVTAIDMTGDNRPDMITTNDLSSDVSVLKNNGDGTFQAPFESQSFPGAHGVAAGDFNHDGKNDVAAGRTNGVVVLAGSGIGSLGAPVSYTTGFSPEDLTVGDFNGDGWLDIVTANYSSNNLSVLLNNRDGTFTPSLTLPTGSSSGPFDVVAADFNNDGKTDIAAALRGVGFIGVFLGNGDGTFGALNTFNTGHSVVRLAAEDFNNDGNLDLAAVGQASGTTTDFVVLSGNGNGTFQPFQSYAGTGDPTDIVAGDFNGDGLPDLASTSSWSPGNVAVMLNTSPPPGPATHFGLTGPAGATAGQSFSVTVTARAADNSLASGYHGTVHFTSDDTAAGLPADYTFTVADRGRHTFSVTLKTAGPRTVTTTDTSTPTITGSAGVPVSPAVAATFVLTGLPGSVTAGDANPVTLTVKDVFNNTVSGYTGTVHFTATDPQAGLPADYPFSGADAGQHVFSVTLKTAGPRSVTVTDTLNPSLTAGAAATVSPAAASRLAFGQQPTNTMAGQPVTPAVTVRVLDPYGNLVGTGTPAVTLGLGNNPGGATLGGTLTANAGGGVAGFGDLTVSGVGNGYTLVASSPGLTGATSAAFNVTPPVGNFSGTVYADANADGARQAGEAGLPAVAVFLDLNGNGALDPGESVQTTDALGNYAFTNVPVGTYTVRLRVLSGGGVPTGSAGGAMSVTVTANGSLTGRDFGEVPASALTPVHVYADRFGPHPNADGQTALVRGLYRSVLGRDADPAGLAAGLNALGHGVTPAALAAVFWNSAEHRGRQVDSYYRNLLGRDPDPQGRANAIAFLQAGSGEAALVEFVLGSSELAQAGDTVFATTLYRAILGRDPAPSEVANVVNYLQAGGNRQALVRFFAESPESYGRLVDSYYLAYLHRAADPNGRTNSVNALISGALTVGSLAAILLGSGEYQAQAQAATP
jgi:hypothetical protein